MIGAFPLDEGDLGAHKDACLLAEAAFKPNDPEARDALALELFGDCALSRGRFKLAWDMFQQRYEQGVL